ncbi:MAG: hypothetical protein COB84_02085 [Rhodobacteraceae bacterium]|nr:MAG: hypothetical protein COB84_02085 [Paracoccaceae bacterium]
MLKTITLIFAVVLGVTACTTPEPDDGTYRPKVFRISAAATNKIMFRHLDTVNEIRTANGLQPVELSAQLNAAAKTHSVDMSNQQRPWHFGSDGSSPLDRVARSGYTGLMLGENISETYENDTETLEIWMRDADTRSTILDQRARYLGFAWYQERNGKIWWTQLMGG